MTAPKLSAAAIDAPLLPCPFCGQPPKTRTPPDTRFWCANEQCLIGSRGYITFTDPVLWNRRVPAAEPGLHAAAQAFLDALNAFRSTDSADAWDAQPEKRSAAWHVMYRAEQALRAALAAPEEPHESRDS